MSISTAAAHDSSPAPESRFFGYPETRLGTTWTIREVCVFFGVSERKARELLSQDDAPPRLRLGSERCDRWNPYQLLAWVHHQDWRQLRWTNSHTDPVAHPTNAAADGGDASQDDATSGKPAPTRAWRPAPASPRGRR